MNAKEFGILQARLENIKKKTSVLGYQLMNTVAFVNFAESYNKLEILKIEDRTKRAEAMSKLWRDVVYSTNPLRDIEMNDSGKYFEAYDYYYNKSMFSIKVDKITSDAPCLCLRCGVSMKVVITGMVAVATKHNQYTGNVEAYECPKCNALVTGDNYKRQI